MKTGNSFHSYFINHNDEWLRFVQLLKEFEAVQNEFLRYNNELFDVFINGDLKRKQGTVSWNLSANQIHKQFSMMKELAFDVACIARSIYFELLHKYDRVVDIDVSKQILHMIDRMIVGDKKACLRSFEFDFGRFVRYTKVQPLRNMSWTNGITSEKLINVVTKYQENLHDFIDGAGYVKTSRNKNQISMDDYLN